MTDRIIPSYDQNGSLAGVLNVDDVERDLDRVTAAAIASLDDDRETIIDRLNEALAGQSEAFKITALKGTIADILDTFSAIVDITETIGVPTRQKLRETFIGEGQ
ncbi:hypothetical protein MTQ12_00205 [Brevibacterium sp. R8603A2]|uniref:hypothetical protein n=1 Tax=Brevibacterium sp. R8603A2 TaxID=2929779 RepID=UPI001FF91CFB|nr:hypothetical protein [Brevibacterium sp. R8603A2]MCK1801482.1 hypothetical protein [Brevibacterium sp. R8603A2]